MEQSFIFHHESKGRASFGVEAISIYVRYPKPVGSVS
jgi:hypothetical protein